MVSFLFLSYCKHNQDLTNSIINIKDKNGWVMVCYRFLLTILLFSLFNTQFATSRATDLRSSSGTESISNLSVYFL